MPAIPTTRTRRLRPWVLLCATFAVVAAMLATTSRPARAADLGCLPTSDAGPYGIAVSGPAGSSTDQPVNQQVRLTLMGSGGAVVPGTTTCGDTGDSFTVSVGWASTTASTTPSNPTVTYGNLIGQVGYTGTVTIVKDSPTGLGFTHVTTTVVQQAVGVTLYFYGPPPTVTGVTAAPGATVGQPEQFSATATHSQPVQSWQWTFGDGSPTVSGSDTITHTFAARGTYTVTARAIDTLGFSGTNTADVVVSDPITPLFDLSSATVALGAPVHLDGGASTTDAAATVTGFAWDFGDGQHGTGSSVSHVYSTTGPFTITETVSDSLGRTATATHDVTVTEPAGGGTTPPAGNPPVAAFTTTTTHPTAASPVSFDGTGSSDSDGSIVGYAWTFGDGATGAGATPQHTYASGGSYPVTLTVTDDSGLTRSVTQLVPVGDAAPTAAFTATPPSPAAGSPVSFDGTGSGDVDGTVRSYAWDLGDGSTGTGPTPGHTYARAGSYAVVLTVTDDAGLTATATHTVTVGRAAPTAAMVLPAGAVAASPVSFDGTPSSDVDGTVTGYAWDFGDGSTATGPTPAHTFVRPGPYTITLTVTDDDGLTDTTSRTLDVTGAPPVAVFAAPTGSAGVSTAFDGTASSDPDGSITGYVWDFGDGSTALGATPGHTFATANTYPVTLTVTDADGLKGSVTHLVTVGTAQPTAAFLAAATAPTVGTPVSFDAGGSSAPGGAITGYAWTFGDGGTATGATPSHTYRAPGSYPVTLTVTDAAGNTASVTHVVDAHWPATDLAVAVGGSVPRAGQYTYRVTVKNLGRAGAHGVVLLNTLDSAQVLAGKVVAPAGLTCGGVPIGATGTITCTASPSAILAAGKSWVVTFTVRQPSAGRVRSVTESSRVREANPDPVAANDAARLTTTLR